MKMKFTVYYEDRIETRIFNEMNDHSVETNDVVMEFLETYGKKADWKGTQWKNPESG